MPETPHCEQGHFCVGCDFSMTPHTGCIVNGDVRIQKVQTPEYLLKEKGYEKPQKKQQPETLPLK